jgi:transposase-like protein
MIVCPKCKSWDYYSHHYNGRNYYYCTECGESWYYTTATSASTTTIDLTKKFHNIVNTKAKNKNK